MTITARTRVLTLLGDPVAHSASPELQNAAFEAAGVDGVYGAVRCGPEDLAGFMRGLAKAGGGGNVTIPHKEKAATFLDVRSEAVRRTGACNTFWGDEAGRVHGDNTDVEGFRRALRDFLDVPVVGLRALLLGGGGAARAALLGLLQEDAAEVCIYNRTQERARAVARRIGGQRARVVPILRGLEGEDFDLVVNATSLGLHEGDASPIDFHMLNRAGAAMDVVYGRHTTSFVKAAEKAGIRATDGLEMLVHQGAVSFERWWGHEAPVEAMRAVLALR
ncbi:MAG: shikimate dehydrogenase [Gemmatimonadetes bacterium]|nr:shikimate dehydrogenase [Gemmatimonadota bacterium]NNL31162.1 shikimate dehydrogenase [Gemmatimonadota bacterium]